jgi:hypothetical protein
MSNSPQKKKKDSNYMISQIIPKIISNFSHFYKINNIKDISHELPTSPLDFIKQKKKFIIHDSFDKRGAKNFLKSKEEAMMEIKLDDEIVEEIKDKNKYNANSSFIETKPDINYSKNNDKSRERAITISPVLRKKKVNLENLIIIRIKIVTKIMIMQIIFLSIIRFWKIQKGVILSINFF